MTKRSFFLTVAAGLLASVAFATPSQAANQTVTTSVTFSASGGGGQVSDFQITLAPSVDAIVGTPTVSGTLTGVTVYTSLAAFPGPPPTTLGASTVGITFTAVSSGSFVITLVTPSTAPGFNAASFSFSGNATTILSSVTVSPNAIPEPTSMALLGIGMTGFLAFRRLFKRGSVALTS